MKDKSPKSFSFSRLVNAVITIIKKPFGHTAKGVTETIYFIRKELPSAENSNIISTDQNIG